MPIKPETVAKSAGLSRCNRYRYTLSRVWDHSRPLLTFIMLNPSTADANEDDPTIRKCIGFAQRFKYGGIFVVNLFAFRATKPADLYKEIRFTLASARGPLNDDFLIQAAKNSDTTIVAAWGKPGSKTIAAEADRVHRVVQGYGGELFCLRRNNDGSPAHPLMLPYSCTLEQF